MRRHSDSTATTRLRFTGGGLVLFAGLLFSLPVQADNMRCDGRLVQRGDRKVEVLKDCGEPSYRHRSGGITAWYHGHRLSADEVWFYDRGASRLLYRLLFRGPELVLVTTEGFGHPDRQRARCGTGDIRRGMSIYVLLVRCGEPMHRERWVEHRPAYRGGDTRRRPRPGPAVEVEEWTYDLGGNHFLRFVRIRDGRVESVELGDRGG